MPHRREGVPADDDNCPDVFNQKQIDRGGIGAGSAPDGVVDNCQCADVNGSGSVTSADATILFNFLRGVAGAHVPDRCFSENLTCP